MGGMNGQILRACAAGLAVIVSAALLAGCGKDKPQRMACPAGELCLEYGNSTDPSTLDPQLMSLVNEATIVRALSEGLYVDSASGEAVPGLALSHETSPDGLTWTFHLRRAKWSDGAP